MDCRALAPWEKATTAVGTANVLVEMAAARQSYVVGHRLDGSGGCARGARCHLHVFVVVGEVDVEHQRLLAMRAHGHGVIVSTCWDACGGL